MASDKKMVNLIEEWEVLEKYTGQKLGFYQLINNDGSFEIRVQTGKIGIKKEFKTGDDPDLIKILDFCEKKFFIQVSEHLRDEDFFK